MCRGVLAEQELAGALRGPQMPRHGDQREGKSPAGLEPRVSLALLTGEVGQCAHAGAWRLCIFCLLLP